MPYLQKGHPNAKTAYAETETPGEGLRMKSRFFTDTQDLDTTPRIADRVSVCLLLDRRTLEQMLREAGRLGLSSGEYIDLLVLGRLPPTRKM